MQWVHHIRDFMRDEEGAVAIEYALVAAGIAGIVAVFFATDAGGFQTLLTNLFAKISAAASKTA